VGTTCTVPSAPPVTFELNVVSPVLITMGSSVEKVFTFARSTVTSPAVSLLIVSLPPSALTILPLSLSPLRNRISSAAARPATTSDSVSAHASNRSDRPVMWAPPRRARDNRQAEQPRQFGPMT